jgi:formate dehydrogenase subunit delta
MSSPHISHSQLDQLIAMANQIADNNTHHDSEKASVDFIALHIKKFWARSMKQQIVAYAKTDGSALNKLAREALVQLTEQYS